MALELLKITGSQPYYLNNASTAEELTLALEDFMRTGTQIIFQHDGEDCILSSFEYKSGIESTVIAYFVTPKKKLLKVDIGAGLDLVITESEFTPETDTTLTKSGKPADAKAVGQKFNEYATKTYVDSAVANSGGGGGGGIFDVIELPTTNINENAFYRLTTANLYYNKYLNGTTNIVNGLPSTGDAFTTDFQSISVTYYNVADSTLYCYVPSYIGSMAGIPEGWYPATNLTAVLGFSWGGVVTSLTDMVNENTFYLLVQNPLYFYKNGKWIEVPTEGAALTLKSKRVSSLQEMIEFCVSKAETLFRIMAVFKHTLPNGAGSVSETISKSILAYKAYAGDSGDYYLCIDLELLNSSYRRFGVFIEAEYSEGGSLIKTTMTGAIEQYTYSNVNGSLSATGIEFLIPTSLEIRGDIIIQYFA